MLFECGLRFLKSFLSGQQSLYNIRVQVSVPRIIFLGLEAPPYYSSAGFGPSNHFLGLAVPLQNSSMGSGPSNRFFRIFDAYTIFECGVRSLKLFLSGHQPLYFIQVWAASYESYHLVLQCLPINRTRVYPFESLFCYERFHLCPKHGGNKLFWMPYVKYEGKSTVSNTRWPDIHIKRLLPR
jgi:hypothetical protein